MKTHHPISLAVLATAIVVSTSALGQGSRGSHSFMGSQSGSSGSNGQMQGMHRAMAMVPARAVLVKALDAKKTPPGSQFEAKLVQKVHLKDGTELPSGTTLMGTVVEDDMQNEGMSKLALRIDKARTKDGKTIPVKATIVGVDKPQSISAQNVAISPGDEQPNSWNDGTLKVDQLGVNPGVDLHSSVASKNSGVFVSKTKDNVNLKANSELELAIAGRPGGMGGDGGGANQ